MSVGGRIVIKSGHTLVIPEGESEPGFLVTVSPGTAHEEQAIIQAGQDTSWLAIINHAKEIAETEIMRIAGGLAIQKSKSRTKS